MRFTTAQLFDSDYDPFCHFGIVSAPLAAFLATDVGLGATAGTIGAGVLEGAGFGAVTSGITGGDPLTGALTGGLTGGAVGAAGAAGLGTIGQTAAGGAAGLLGAEVTGQNPLTGALTGAAGGLISGSGALGGGTPSGTTSITSGAPTGTSGGISAASTAPAAIAPTGSPAADPTSVAATAAPAASTAATGASSVTSDPLSNSLLGAPDTTGFGGAQNIVARSTAAPASNVLGGITGGGDSTGIGGFLTKNPGLALGVGALGLSALQGSQPLPGETALQQQAGEAASHARVLESYQQTGTLPPGLSAAVDRHTENAVASIRSQYAQLGMAGSTSEAAQIANAKQAASTQIAEIADNLAKQGISWEALSAQDLDNVLRAQQQRDQSFTSALASFASGLAGGFRPSTSSTSTGTGTTSTG